MVTAITCFLITRLLQFFDDLLFRLAGGWYVQLRYIGLTCYMPVGIFLSHGLLYIWLIYVYTEEYQQVVVPFDSSQLNIIIERRK